jgi:hypothetical protein
VTVMTAATLTGRVVSRAPSWVPVVAWGFGLVSIALGAASIIGVQADALSRALGAAAVVVGLAALAWGAAGLALGRTPLPRSAVAGVFAGSGVSVSLLATQPGRASVLAIALLLALAVAVACGIVRGTRHPSSRSSLRGLAAAAAIVTLVVVPALGICQGAALLAADGTVLPVVSHDGH